MRWLIGGFIAVNLLVLVLQLMFRTDASANDESVAKPVAIDSSIPRLKLLSELDDSTLVAMRLPQSQRQAAEESQGNGLCTLVGPFSKLLRAEYFQEHLTALELKAEVRELEIPGETGYWVYLPPLGSTRQAFNLLRELQAKNIDSYVIPGGELENGISFGMFSQKDLADRRLQDMRKQGYEVELKEVVRSYQEIWVVLEPGQAGQLSQETWQQMVLEENDELELRQNYCPPVASE